MYSFRAIVVGLNETEAITIRRALTNLSVTIAHEFPGIDQVISQRALLADSRCFFLVKVNSTADMDELLRLSQFFLGKPIVALLNADSDVSAVLQIQRAGAAQVLMLPLRPDDVGRALDTVARQFGCAATRSKVIAVLGASEGCGSTSLAINLSDAFASVQQQSCILVELSLRLGRIASYIALEPTVTVTDLLVGDMAVDVTAVNQALVQVTERFQAIAGPHRTLDRRPIAAGRVLPLIGAVRQMADVVVLDLPYTFDDLYFDALSGADHIVLVASSNPPSIQALKLISETVAAVAATQHLVINCYGQRIEEFSRSQLHAALATEQLWTIADDPEGFASAKNSGQRLALKSPAWPAITALAGKITGLEKSAAPARTTWSWLADLFHNKPAAVPAIPSKVVATPH